MKRPGFCILLTLTFILPFIVNGCIPSKPTEEVEILPSERLIKRLEANRRKVKNFEGFGTISISSPELNANASIKVILQKPDSLYFEIYGPFGIDLAQAVITNESFLFYDIMNNKVYRGNNNSEALKNIFKLDISFNDLLEALTGAVNLTPKLSSEPSDYNVVYDKYILTYDDQLSEVITRYYIDIRDLVITEYQLLDRSENVFLDGVFSKFSVLESIPVPFNTNIKYHKQNQSIKIEYRKAEINKDNLKLTMEIPTDAEVEEW